MTSNFKNRIKYSKKILKTLKGRSDKESIAQYIKESKKLEEIYVQREVFWKQRSKQLWLREGDHNSKYFHATTRTRKKTNQIMKLQNNDDQVVEWNNGLEDTMIEYFNNLLKASNTQWDDVVNCISQKITEEQNIELLKPVEDKEVKTTLFHMHPDKSPGPDDMNPTFYQKCWSIVGKDIIQLLKKIRKW